MQLELYYKYFYIETNSKQIKIYLLHLRIDKLRQRKDLYLRNKNQIFNI